MSAVGPRGSALVVTCETLQNRYQGRVGMCSALGEVVTGPESMDKMPTPHSPGFHSRDAIACLFEFSAGLST